MAVWFVVKYVIFGEVRYFLDEAKLISLNVNLSEFMKICAVNRLQAAMMVENFVETEIKNGSSLSNSLVISSSHFV